MAELKPFSGVDPECPKCQAADVDYAYHPPGTMLLALRPDGVILGSAVDAPEWMLRTCRLCGYAWAETCADSPAGGAQ